MVKRGILCPCLNFQNKTGMIPPDVETLLFFFSNVARNMEKKISNSDWRERLSSPQKFKEFQFQIRAHLHRLTLTL